MISSQCSCFLGKGRVLTWTSPQRFELPVGITQTIVLTVNKLQELALVFSKDYQFQIRQELLKEGEKVKLQLDSILADFMYHAEGPHNLGIVHYAGHGFHGEGYGQLNLTKWVMKSAF